jgi:sulfhydrogenase subunit gamma (sulfur reductase)
MKKGYKLCAIGALRLRLKIRGRVQLGNPYLPYPVRIDRITTETEDKNLKTFRFVFLNPEDEEKFAYTPGQFGELSIAGKGEIPIGIASSPRKKGLWLLRSTKWGSLPPISTT